MKNRRFKILLVIVFASIFFAGGSVETGKTQTPEKPLTLVQIITELQSKSSVISLAEKNEVLISIVRRRGVNFTLTPQIDAALKEAGANAGLIKAIGEGNSSSQSPAGVANDVSLEFFRQQYKKSKEERSSPVGQDIEGVNIPPELRNSITKQIAKINQMKESGFKMPMDFGDLALKVSTGEIVELPLATTDHVLDIGGSATGDEFREFSFEDGEKPLAPDSEKYRALKQFANSAFDLDDPNDRRQIRLRLLRTLQPHARTFLESLAAAYRQRFARPLRINSLNRSLDYQIDLNRTDPNSFVVRNADAVPPHTTALAFDISYGFLDAEEQNFLMQKMAEWEKAGAVDALREGGTNAVFHVFVLSDNALFTEKKSYAGMSASEKTGFIAIETNKILDRFGRTNGDEISDEGLASIKRFVDAYAARINSRDSSGTCRFGQDLKTVLTRGGQSASVIRKSFAAEDLPPETGIYTAMIESEFCPCLQSPTGTLGMFQFTYSLAREYGLNAVRGASPADPDERCSPEPASRAAARWLKDSIKYTGERIGPDHGQNALGLPLAIAAYNSGQGALKKNIESIKSGQNKVSFWDLLENSEKLSQQFQSENIKYVPKFFAAAIIGENPAVFGIDNVQPLSRAR